MTKHEFTQPFSDLMKAYGAKFTEGQITSFFDELRSCDVRDFCYAVRRIPANEVRGFPPASVVRNYILDAKEGRILREKTQEPKSIEDVARRYSLKRDISPEQAAWAKLCASMIRVGVVSREAKMARVRLIEQFIDERGDWLGGHYEEREWLQWKLREAS